MLRYTTRDDYQRIKVSDFVAGYVELVMRSLFGITAQWSDGTWLPESYQLVVGFLSDQEVIDSNVFTMARAAEVAS